MDDQFSQEESNLYNPAYVGTLLYQSIREYKEKRQEGMHCGLVYLIAPLCLYQTYAEILPKRKTFSVFAWAKKYEGQLSDFPDTVNAYVDIVNSALIFLIHQKVLSLTEDGVLLIMNDSFLPKKPAYILNNITFHRHYLSAGLLGRWFAETETPDGIYRQLGVRP